MEGSQSAYKCNHVPESTPENEPEFYLWNSCTSQLSQLEDTPSGAYIPQCTNDGGYQLEQCWPSTNQCWCADDYGNKLTEPVVGSVAEGCSGIIYIYTIHMNKIIRMSD